MTAILWMLKILSLLVGIAGVIGVLDPEKVLKGLDKKYTKGEFLAFSALGLSLFFILSDIGGRIPYYIFALGFVMAGRFSKNRVKEEELKTGVISAQGVSKKLMLCDNKIVIKATNKKLKDEFGDVEILIDKLSSIQFKEAGAFSKGFIHFSIGTQGYHSPTNLAINMLRLKPMTSEETAILHNTIHFDKNEERHFLTIKAELEKRMVGIHRGVSNQNSSLDELEKLAQLRDKGIITVEDFEIKKKQILGI